MSEFDLDSYFANRRLNAAIAETNGQGVHDRYLDLQRASQERSRQLAEASAMRTANLAKSKDSWVTQNELDPNSIRGSALNLAAEAYSGASNVAGQIAAVPHALLAASNQANLSEQDIAALDRHSQGVATAEDLIQINRKVAPQVATGANMPDAQARAQALADGNPNAPTPLKIWGEMNSARATSRAIKESFDRSGLVQQDARTAFTESLKEGYDPGSIKIGDGLDAFKSGNKVSGAADVISGVAKLLFNAGKAAAGNPRAVLGYMAENAPQLFLGAAGKVGAGLMTTSNLGYAADTYNEGIETYQAKHGGALPPEDDRRRMAFQAATLMAAEQVGDVVALGLAKGGAKGVVDSTRASFLASLKTAGKASGTGFLTEAPTEGYQTWAEGEIKGKPATGEEIYTGAVIGGFSGAGLSGGGRAVSEAALLASQPSAPKAEKAEKNYDPAKAAVVDAAIASGDVSGLIDPTKPAYAPDQAIRALFGHSQLATTTDEAKQVNLTKADEIIAELESERDIQQSYLKTPKDKQAEIVELQTKMAAADPDKATKFKSLIDIREAELAEPELSADVVIGIKARVDNLNRLVKDASLARDNLSELVQSKGSVESLVSQADRAASPDQDNTKAIDRVITLAMASPGRLDPKMATQLADNTANALTAPQRDYLRTFSEARVAENQLMDMGGVSADIYIGKKNKGIAQYQAAFGRALTAGRSQLAEKELAGLIKFEQDHTGKATIAAKALSNGLGTQIVSDGQGGWSIPTAPLSKSALSTNGGLAINTARIVESITTEAGALTKAVAEMKSAYSIKFTAGEANVTNKSQKTQGSKPRLEATQQPAGQTTGPSGASVNTGVVPGDATTNIDAPSPGAAVALETPGVVVPVAPKEEEDPARVIDLRKRISMLEKIRKCMGG